MIEIIDKTKCCGCSACYNICPQKCIEMIPDEEGFSYPKVNIDQCTNCGLCNKVCPEISGYMKENIKKAYACRNKDMDCVDSSTSGGVFSALASYCISLGGIVAGAAFNDQFEIHHKLIQTQEEIHEFRGSKYVQSDLSNTFSQIKEYLIISKLVLFSGTPCQVAGLNNYLGKNFDNLITVEVICHGTPSPKLWKLYLGYQEKRYKSNPIKISFRKKTYGYHSGTMEIIFSNGKRYRGSPRIDYMLKSYFTEICARPSCYDCTCKDKFRAADISIFDCWSITELVESILDDDKGYTNVLINSNKGMQYYSKVKSLLLQYEVDMNRSIEFDGIMVTNNPVKNKYRDVFYKELDQSGIKGAVKRYIPITMIDYILECSKLILYKLEILNLLKKIIGK